VFHGGGIKPLPHAESSVMKRIPMLQHNLWVTAFDESERYAGGDYPNQRACEDGVSRWARADRSLVDAQLVCWVVFGTTHVPRVEDWPIMPAERVGFVLQPNGFFDANPTIDVPPHHLVRV
jgi:primary-amine oxidase